MPNEDRSVWVTFNGELYNWPEVRPQLAARGHVFRGNSDTEMLLHLWEEKGAGDARRPARHVRVRALRLAAAHG